MLTNRQWLETLTDEEVAKLFTIGLTVESFYSVEPFEINIFNIAKKIVSSNLGIADWLAQPTDYIIKCDKKRMACGQWRNETERADFYKEMLEIFLDIMKKN